MNGTEKQITWATDIKAAWIAKGTARIEKWSARDDKPELAARLITDAEAWIATVEAINDAATLIDTRHGSASNLLDVAKHRDLITTEQRDAALTLACATGF
ncbi:hypothetical protein KVF89_22295 [Nocardioides carbamazepini]|uniref:hypothetical protein n=1 Tax=Nocardioides carbamazepini TaxID=2854259 RepID=UPI00214A0483|nr:hypothetical protein [Nocardioides carbamazepini]MCR1785287.1 hypothetical protein [Nocardioides carbamazepini]